MDYEDTIPVAEDESPDSAASAAAVPVPLVVTPAPSAPPKLMLEIKARPTAKTLQVHAVREVAGALAHSRASSELAVGADALHVRGAQSARAARWLARHAAQKQPGFGAESRQLGHHERHAELERCRVSVSEEGGRARFFVLPSLAPHSHSTRHRQFLSLTPEQVEKAGQLSDAIRKAGTGAVAVDAAQLATLAVADKLALLRKRVGPAQAGALMEQLVVDMCAPEARVSADFVARRLDALLLAPADTLVEERDWNGEFQVCAFVCGFCLLATLTGWRQTLLEMEDGVEKFALLRGLYTDFGYAADAYGRIIISERYLPVEMKTIRPAKMGGFAGGEKYIVRNIMFKFAVDQRNDATGKWLYGGEQPNDEAAMVAWVAWRCFFSHMRLRKWRPTS